MVRFIFLVIVYLLLIPFTTLANYSNVEGYGGSKWGDKVDVVKKSIKVKREFSNNQKGFFCVVSEKTIAGKLFNVIYSFDEKNNSLVQVDLISDKDTFLTKSEVMALLKQLKKKYGNCTKNADQTSEVYEWFKESGNLTFGWIVTWAGTYHPVMLIYEKKISVKQDDL